ncbi:MAG: purine-nucleoside phosphorylase [Lachnospiraceae bacterium]|uniref:Purine nucleoside phosphorylase n=1 Tax=Candidatus Weimeria bifida TaxID=2599074 RepID=A0A6N7J239_9FIRM|nr:purine-nucleoside phosphorylase [Candidatus Weimeria bifida]RRF96779.1 MAG: purine-nucleoside phosphorylase [Lachnospiraceae bacterium]
MSEIYEQLQKALKSIRKVTDFVPEIGITLGSGLGGLSEKIDKVCEISYKDIEGFPVSTVSGHDGKFIFGNLSGRKVVCMSGRVHFYEGYKMSEVVMPVRIMGLLGAKIILLTNAAGGINTDFKPGDLMIIRDHISVFVQNPLIGQNPDELGVRFPDMSSVYDKALISQLEDSAAATGITLQKGVYIQLTGPSYETPTEIKMLRTLGADAAGMSTVVEAIAANHMGLRVAGVSCITNMAAGILDQPLNHEEVKATADAVKDKFERLVMHFVQVVH